MTDVVIHAENLGKRYSIGKRERYRALRDSLAEKMSAPLRRIQNLLDPVRSKPEEAANTIWALRQVGFEIRRGEAVGVIGRNGAGKSTLLKILSRITEPTEGRVEIRGRVGSLLEVGTGFHPELTGRENVFLNGAILGMRRMEIERRFDEIVAFAEVEEFLDTPVKHYSSGMYMRLAFAVAAHLHPDILVVDEVLAVGDAAFQKKCLRKMETAGREGRTVLLVSHNLTAVKSLCTRALLIERGTLVQAGDVNEVVRSYLQRNMMSLLERRWDVRAEAPGDKFVRVHRIAAIPVGIPAAGMIRVDTPIDIEVWYWNEVPNTLINITLLLHNGEGVCVFNTISTPRRDGAGLVRQVCEIPANLLNDGTYRVQLLLVKDTSVILVNLQDTITFDVHDVERPYNWYGKWVGAVRPSLDWRAEFIGDAVGAGV